MIIPSKYRVQCDGCSNEQGPECDSTSDAAAAAQVAGFEYIPGPGIRSGKWLGPKCVAALPAPDR
jgi:hypothetical protein